MQRTAKCQFDEVCKKGLVTKYQLQLLVQV